jgi:SAM-dependent methyltransferase
MTETKVHRHPTVPAPAVDDGKFIFFLEKVPGPWGDVLDAGTGPASLDFLAACPLSAITAVTGNESSVRSTLAESGKYLDQKLDQVIAGNWKDPEFQKGRQYDVVLADWLLGSVEFFAPHFQVGLLRRLRQLVKPSGVLLFTGREPDDLKANATVGARLLLDIDTLRDSAATLSLRRPYREIPQWWVEEELGVLGFEIMHKERTPLTLDSDYIFSQLAWAEGEISHVQDEQLRAALQERAQDLHARARRTQSVWETQSSGNEYALVARLS